MARELRREELTSIVYGSSFYGGGGGGSAEEGLALIEAMYAEDPDAFIKMIDIVEMEDDPNVVSTMIAALGSPVATKGRTFQDESVNAVKGMSEEARFLGKELKYVYSGEMGGGNTMLPLYAAWKCGLPIIDTDGNGRAVPELNTGLLPVHGVPTSPVILASEAGDTIVARTEDSMDGAACEKIARYMCQAFDQGIGFAAWMMNKDQHKDASALGQMTLAIEVGDILMKTPAAEAVEKLQSYFGEKKIPFSPIVSAGTIVDIQIDSAGGFDTGVTTVRADNGEEFKVVFQNENLYVEAGEKTLVTIPSIISTLDLGDEKHAVPVSNSETYVGQRIALTAVKADDRWYDMPECYECWNEVMVSADYRNAKPEVKFW
ncbi:DUF917 domain-containing protein [Emergencia sp. 1XD21-10]|uniref:DUF917 domain-containing protein n=1 Tax=Emergencia sp. 1XD21-10 TaxID=2304569 RepID=UPI00137A8FED|nr:DUF917 domain-containing protein [Emergencia sp. 1XD21-10]MCI9639234.1 DUF917 domain-containing protein [Emergencia sp.]NCE99833.1 DUF917 domain-containing protein [Emergencia sp. 1XD21-10]